MNPARCARPACPGTAAAWLAYDYDARCAWLDDDIADSGPNDRKFPAHAWPLCERHADTLKVPRGWFCVDRRASHFGPGDTAPELDPAGQADHTSPGPAPVPGPPGDDPTGARSAKAPRGAKANHGGGRTSTIL